MKEINKDLTLTEAIDFAKKQGIKLSKKVLKSVVKKFNERPKTIFDKETLEKKLENLEYMILEKLGLKKAKKRSTKLKIYYFKSPFKLCKFVNSNKKIKVVSITADSKDGLGTAVYTLFYTKKK